MYILIINYDVHPNMNPKIQFSPHVTMVINIYVLGVIIN